MAELSIKVGQLTASKSYSDEVAEANLMDFGASFGWEEFDALSNQEKLNYCHERIETYIKHRSKEHNDRKVEAAADHSYDLMVAE